MVHKHRLVVFRNPDKLISPEDLLKMSSWFGKIESESFFKHPQSPSDDIYRVSNDKDEGYTEVGIEGWHIDGEYYIRPHSVMCLHAVKASVGGSTHFTPMSNMIDALDDPKYEDMYFCTGDEDQDFMHKLIYVHPITGDKTLFYHPRRRMIKGMACGVNLNNFTCEKMLSMQESFEIIEELMDKMDERRYEHEWQDNDLVVMDN